MSAEQVLAIIPVGADGPWFADVDGVHRRLSGWALVRLTDELDAARGEESWEIVRGIVPGAPEHMVDLDACRHGDELGCLVANRCPGDVPATFRRRSQVAA